MLLPICFVLFNLITFYDFLQGVTKSAFRSKFYLQVQIIFANFRNNFEFTHFYIIM